MLLEVSFPGADGPPPAAEERVASLKTLVEARQEDDDDGGGGGGRCAPEKSRVIGGGRLPDACRPSSLLCSALSGGGGGVWRRLRDIHEAVGLGHQWGGSYCNKTLLGCLGIDTRNIVRLPAPEMGSNGIFLGG